MKKSDLRICFFGTDEYSVYVLDELLLAGIEPALIITAPDTKQGRGMVLTSPPVKEWAEEQEIDYLQPESLKGDEVLDALQNTEWDVFILASYGKIIPQSVIDIPTHGILNVHPSLLPELRGASPLQGAILQDKRETGTTVMLLDSEMDHGPIVAQARIEPEEWPLTTGELGELLFKEGARLLAEALLPYLSGEIVPEEQDHNAATFTKMIKKNDGFLDLTEDPYANYLKIRAFDGWPGTYFFHTKESGDCVRVKVTRASYDAQENTLTIERVIPEGKKEMSYEDFLRG